MAITLAYARYKCEIESTYSAVLGLRDDEEENNGLDSAPDAEDNVCLPCNVGKCNRHTELVGQQACLIIYVSICL